MQIRFTCRHRILCASANCSGAALLPDCGGSGSGSSCADWAYSARICGPDPSARCAWDRPEHACGADGTGPDEHGCTCLSAGAATFFEARCERGRSARTCVAPHCSGTSFARQAASQGTCCAGATTGRAGASGETIAGRSVTAGDRRESDVCTTGRWEASAAQAVEGHGKNPKGGSSCELCKVLSLFLRDLQEWSGWLLQWPVGVSRLIFTRLL